MKVNGHRFHGGRKTPPTCSCCQTERGAILIVMPDPTHKEPTIGFWLCPKCYIRTAEALKASWDEPGPLCDGCPYTAACPDAFSLDDEREERACPD